MKITKLTQEQTDLMSVYRDRWTEIGLSTEPANRPAAEIAIRKVYACAGLTAPEQIIWCGSPLSQGIVRAILADKNIGASVVDSVRDSVGDSVRASVRDSVGDSGYGAHDAGWLGFYAYFREVCGLTEQIGKLSGLIDLAHHAGWFIPHQNVCFVSDRHNVLNRDEQGRLHCTSGPAVAYPDGWGVYAWHGIRVPPEAILKPGYLTVKGILAEKNTEVRRALRNLYGNARFLKDAGARVISESPTHGAKLLSLRLDGDPEDIRMAELTCPSTGEVYYERVPPTISNCDEALGWRFRLEPQQYKPVWET